MHVSPDAKVNAKDYSGSAPLHLASQKDNIEVIELLIAGGALVPQILQPVLKCAQNMYRHMLQITVLHIH